jgi:hypothetical protein
MGFQLFKWMTPKVRIHLGVLGLTFFHTCGNVLESWGGVETLFQFVSFFML